MSVVALQECYRRKHFTCGRPGQLLMEPSVVAATTGGAGVKIKYPG